MLHYIDIEKKICKTNHCSFHVTMKIKTIIVLFREKALRNFGYNISFIV